MVSNKALSYGGAVYVHSNGNDDTAATNKSSFALSGSTSSIVSTGNKLNDIFLNRDCSVTVAGSLANDFATRINSKKTDNGTLVLSSNSSSSTDVAYVTNNF